jgi:hypothetical protein
MVRHRLHRCLTTFLVVLSLLFSQLALASYVCPGQADAEAMAAMMEAGVPCEGMDPAQPVLCHQHSVDAAKNVEVGKLTVTAPPALVQVLVLPLVLDPEASGAVRLTAVPEAPPPADPLFLSTLRLRV